MIYPIKVILFIRQFIFFYLIFKGMVQKKMLYYINIYIIYKYLLISKFINIYMCIYKYIILNINEKRD